MKQQYSVRDEKLSERECEGRLIRLWEKNLGSSISKEGDYFQNGGNSLRGTQLLSWIQEDFGVELSLLDLFESRSIATQSALVLSRMREQDCVATKHITSYKFFGPAATKLFGAFHHPQNGRNRAGVVLCYPMGQEYMRIHRTYVELARSLAASGQNVLRFDYFGCGDSSGESTAGNLERWIYDIREAIRELRSRTNVREVYLVGARIGANLALEAGANGEQIAGIVAWEPIVNGTNYLATLQRVNRDLLASNANLTGYEKQSPLNCFTELVGFPISKILYDQLTEIDLSTFPMPSGPSEVLVLANSRKPELECSVTAQRNSHPRVCYRVLEESDSIWLKEDRQNKGLIPHKAVQAIVSWITERAA